MDENDEFSSKLCRLDICTIMHQNTYDFTAQSNQQNAVLQFVLHKLNFPPEEISELALNSLRGSVRIFVNFLIRRYKAHSKHIERLFAEVTMGKSLPESLRDSLAMVMATRAPYNRNPEKKAFVDKSLRGQYLEAQKLRNSFEPGAINLAASQNLTKAGKKDARFVFQKVGSTSGLTAATARKAISTKKSKELIKITPACALGFLLNQDLTRAQFQAIRAISKEKGADIWPSYKEIQSAKLECRPEEIEVSDHSAFVPLQQLLNHTTKRILDLDPSIVANLENLAEENDNQITAI